MISVFRTFSCRAKKSFRKLSRTAASACRAALVKALGAGRLELGFGVNFRAIKGSRGLGPGEEAPDAPAGVEAPLVPSSSSLPNDSKPLGAFFFFFFRGCPRCSLETASPLYFGGQSCPVTNGSTLPVAVQIGWCSSSRITSFKSAVASILHFFLSLLQSLSASFPKVIQVDQANCLRLEQIFSRGFRVCEGARR